MSSNIITAISEAQADTPITSMSDFLRCILPDEGFKCWVSIDRNKKVTQGFVPTIEQLAAKLVEIDARGSDAYHACVSFATDLNRRAANVLHAQSLWRDIDVGAGKPYATFKTAIQDVIRFVRECALPLPHIVASGNGAHIYWPLEQPLGISDWKQLAKAFDRLTTAHGLHADPARSRDIASILRPPGTHNYKSPANPKPVLWHLSKEIPVGGIPTETLLKACDSIHTTVSGAGHTTIEHVPSREQNNNAGNTLSLGIHQGFDPAITVSAGGRNDHCHRYACSLLAKGVSEDEVYRMVLEYSITKCVPSLGEGETRRAIASAIKKHTANHPATAPIPTEWPEPQKIEIALLPVPPLSLSIIPEPYTPWVADVAHRMQCPPDIAASGAIVMTGSVIGAGCGIRPKRYDDWLVVPNLYGGAVGRPSVLMKSPTLAEMLKPLARLETEAKQAYDTASLRHEAEAEHVKALRTAIKRDMAAKNPTGNADSLKDKYTALAAPTAPIWRRYRTNDSTIEKLSELLNENPRGMLVFRDELTGLLTSWERSGHEQDRAFYLEAWNGCGSNYSDRIGRGTIYTENMCVSIFGGIQPAKLQQYFHDNRLANDGMFQRFQMLVCPDEPADWALIDQYPNKDAKNRAYDIIKKLSMMDFTKYGATVDDFDKLPFYRFADDAQEFFNEWLTILEKQKIRGNDEPIFIEHLAKYKKLMPALALIFHLIDIADGKAVGAVSKAAAEKAAAWCDYLEAHARRIYGLAGSLAMQAAGSLARRIARGEVEDRFTARDIHRHQWSMLTDKEVVYTVCGILAGKNWLHEIETPADFQQKGKVEYVINPKTREFYGKE